MTPKSAVAVGLPPALVAYTVWLPFADAGTTNWTDPAPVALAGAVPSCGPPGASHVSVTIFDAAKPTSVAVTAVPAGPLSGLSVMRGRTLNCTLSAGVPPAPVA